MKAQEFVVEGGFIHLDVADGIFTPWRSWGSPAELKELNISLNVEVHLMVEDPEAVATSWLEAGVKRLIVPIQTIKDIDSLKNECANYGAKLMLSVDPAISMETIFPYIKDLDEVSVLAVRPGMSGQKFEEDALERIKFLREVSPSVKIEVDGGVNPETGARAIKAGADMLVSGGYIFQSKDPAGAFETLNSL